MLHYFIKCKGLAGSRFGAVSKPKSTLKKEIDYTGTSSADTHQILFSCMHENVLLKHRNPIGGDAFAALTHCWRMYSFQQLQLHRNCCRIANSQEP